MNELEQAVRETCNQSGHSARDIADVLEMLATEFHMIADDEPEE